MIRVIGLLRLGREAVYKPLGQVHSITGSVDDIPLAANVRQSSPLAARYSL
jgi:hypothetical protein